MSATKRRRKAILRRQWVDDLDLKWALYRLTTDPATRPVTPVRGVSSAPSEQ